MNNKLNNMINEFLKNVDAKDEKELNERLQEFFKKYNNGEIEYENTPLDNAYELLEKAQKAKSEKQAIKFAKQAYQLCPDCFDAILFQANREDNPIKRNKMIDDGLDYEKKRLTKEKYFEKENIGHFYTIFETRPYVRGLYTKACYLLDDGKVSQAKNVCLEILKLNESDNTGARYLLMAIYAYFEDEKNLIKLYDKYSEQNFEMLFPLFVLYYKLGNDEKAIKYLKLIDKVNPNFKKFIKDEIDDDEISIDGYYQKGCMSEILMYFQDYCFLIRTMQTMEYYVLEH